MSFHIDLAAGKWQTLTLAEQLANIGSEVSRVFHWQRAKDIRQKRHALSRALELIDLTLRDPRWPAHRRQEITHLRDVVRDTFASKHMLHTRPETLEAYFLPFALRSIAAKSW